MKNNQEQQTQFIVTGRIKPTNVGTEVISFSFRLGPVKVICIVNVPDENTDEAPTYVKFELVKPDWKNRNSEDDAG